jgi:hypothetical protein
MVGTIGLSANGGQLSSDPTQYTYPVYVATADTPRHTVSTYSYSRRYNLDGTFTSLGFSVSALPIDASWTSSAGSDSQMVIIDSVTGDEYDIYRYAGAGTYSASRISHYVAGTKRNGQPLDYISRGAGVPYLAGLIRPWEIAQGHIDHAIAFGYPFPAQSRCVGPATKSDGNSTLPMAIPEGARLQLDPTLDAADFDRWGLSATGRIIARAMQRYGIILIDVSGRPKLYAENTMVNSQSSTTWADVGGLNENTVAPIPYTALRVLDLPDGYWSGASDAPMHGICYR